ncbi:undecaprenyl-diphosphatase [Pedococcus dokdonensis]|uniref:Undecaprenyl-diphosphatase n=1 Tax=Pedococcus dokdonensis TaxID=443156 RepID=A0A1H0TRV2_9MICO|nr:phosphatase PAP2 family protein [Pedococcus dokdonensis]SDP56490.1 undecaprenyl-diphosphatase [Pedococcus dokdonensis]
MATDTTKAVAKSHSARLVRGAVAMVLFAVPVLLLGYAVRQKFDPLIRLDNDLIRESTDFTRSHGLADTLIALQGISQPFLLYILATGLCIWVWAARKLRGRALWAFFTMMLAWNVGLLAKLLVGRARPIVQDPISHSPGFSFPSGHAFNAAVVATVVVFLLWPVLGRVGHRVSIVLAVVFALVVGLDRIFLGVHFPSDVLAGYVLGVGITFSSWLGFIGKTSPTSSSGPSHPA